MVHVDAQREPCNAEGEGVSERQRQAFLTLRAALIMALNALDDLLGIPRTIPCRAERRKQLTDLLQ